MNNTKLQCRIGAKYTVFPTHTQRPCRFAATASQELDRPLTLDEAGVDMNVLLLLLLLLLQGQQQHRVWNGQSKLGGLALRVSSVCWFTQFFYNFILQFISGWHKVLCMVLQAGSRSTGSQGCLISLGGSLCESQFAAGSPPFCFSGTYITHIHTYHVYGPKCVT